MKRKLLLLTFLFLSITVFSQEYSYSFEGQLTSESEILILEKISKLPGVEKIRLNNKGLKGEFILLIDMTKENDKEEIFSAADIKAILIEQDLQPLDFTKID